MCVWCSTKLTSFTLSLHSIYYKKPNGSTNNLRQTNNEKNVAEETEITLAVDESMTEEESAQPKKKNRRNKKRDLVLGFDYQM